MFAVSRALCYSRLYVYVEVEIEALKDKVTAKREVSDSRRSGVT
jgi:hypothetical protein